VNQFLPFVNQKRLFASLLLDQAGRVGEQKHLQKSLMEAAIFELTLAIKFYCAEIASSYHSKNPTAAVDGRTLAGVLAVIDRHSPEMQEILDLETDGNSWLSSLQSCYRALSSAPEPGVVKKNQDDNLIASFSLQEQDWSHLTPEKIAEWIQSFSEMLERHRSVMMEC
jgi:hypothetical protein